MQDDHSFWTHPNPFASSSTPTPSNGGPSSNSMPSTPDPPSLLCVPDPLLAQRRPSLPIIVSPPSSSPSSLGLGGINGLSQQSYHQLPQFHHRASMGAVGLVSNGVRNAGAPYNPIHRRRSVDTNMMRLSYHPYAHLAQHANANIYGGVPPHVNPPPPSGNHLGSPYDAARMRHGSMPHVFEGVPQQNSLGISPHQAYFPGPNRRPGIPTRMSMPALMHQQQHQQQQHHQSQDYSTSNPSFGPHVQVSPPPTITSSGSSYEFPSISTNNPAASAPGNGNSQPPSPSTSSPPSNISYTQIQQQHDCAMVYSSREVHKPIPGPLPEANFSFGNPNLSGTTSVHSTPPTVQGQESEDDGTTSVGTGSSYDMHGSRFGSLASVASIGSESSFTSAYYSTEEGACDESLGQGFHPDMRRASV